MQMGATIKVSDYKTDHALAGAISSFLTRFICQPLDVVKIRFQLQVEPIENKLVSKYHSIAQTFFLIFKEEGICALWKGHVPAQFLSITYGASQFQAYHILMKASENFPQCENWKFSTKFIAGAGAGCVATITSFPFDTIRTRFVAQSSNYPVYKGIKHSLSCILQQESPRTFFKGLFPTLLQIVPHSGLQFAFYGFFTDLYRRCSNETSNKNISFYNSMISGSMAGLLAKTAVYPLDLSRKRLQIQGFQHARRDFGSSFYCTGFLDCLRQTVKVEGLRGLFKGLAPSQLKAAATAALHFTTYEQSLMLIKAVRKSYG
nr:mitochondrial thiamine pyrophosphate carrier-like isoform X1 [Megalopta genalis]